MVTRCGCEREDFFEGRDSVANQCGEPQDRQRGAINSRLLERVATSEREPWQQGDRRRKPARWCKTTRSDHDFESATRSRSDGGNVIAGVDAREHVDGGELRCGRERVFRQKCRRNEARTATNPMRGGRIRTGPGIGAEL